MWKVLAEYVYPKRGAVEVADAQPTEQAPMATADAVAVIHAAIDRAIAAKGEWGGRIFSAKAH